MLRIVSRIIKNAILCTLMIVEGIAWLPILLALGAGLIGSMIGGNIGGGTTPGVSGEYPEGEVLGEYPGGLMTFESLTPEQKKIMQAIMGYAMPKLGLPGQAFGQAPAGTTAGVGLGAGGAGGPAQALIPMLSQLLMGGSSGAPRGGGR